MYVSKGLSSVRIGLLWLREQVKIFGCFRPDVAYDLEDLFSRHAREFFQGAFDELLDQCNRSFDGYRRPLLLSGTRAGGCSVDPGELKRGGLRRQEFYFGGVARGAERAVGASFAENRGRYFEEMAEPVLAGEVNAESAVGSEAIGHIGPHL